MRVLPCGRARQPGARSTPSRRRFRRLRRVGPDVGAAHSRPRCRRRQSPACPPSCSSARHARVLVAYILSLAATNRLLKALLRSFRKPRYGCAPGMTQNVFQQATRGFPAKWIPFRQRETRQNKNRERGPIPSDRVALDRPSRSPPPSEADTTGGQAVDSTCCLRRGRGKVNISTFVAWSCVMLWTSWARTKATNMPLGGFRRDAGAT